MPVTQTGEIVSPHYLAGLVAAARIDKTDDMDSYGALEAVSKTVLAAVAPGGLLLPVHNLKITDTTTTVAVVYKGGQLLALSEPDPDGEHLFDLRVRVLGRKGDYTIWVESPIDFAGYAYLMRTKGSKRARDFLVIDESFDDEEWVRHLIAAQVKDAVTARLEATWLYHTQRAHSIREVHTYSRPAAWRPKASLLSSTFT